MEPIRTAVCAVCVLFAAILPAQDKGGQKPPQDKEKPKAAKVVNPKVLMKTSLGDITLELFAGEAPKTVANFVELAEGIKEFTDPKTGKKTKRNYYDGLIFHRVIKNFMAQGGCPMGTGRGGPGYQFADEINAKALGLDKIKALGEKGYHQYLRIYGPRAQQMCSRAVFKKLGITSQAQLDKRREEVKKALPNLTLMDVYSSAGYKYDDSRPSHKMARGTIAMANGGANTNGSQFFINMVDNSYLNGKHTVFGKVLTGMDVVDKMQAVKMKASSQPETPIVIRSIRVLQQ